MSPRLTYKNIAILGLSQIGVVVFGVLGAGATYKLDTTLGVTQTSATRFATEYGFLFLALPLAWIVTAMVVQHRIENVEDGPEALTALTGVIVLLLLIVGAFAAAVAPWGRFCGLSLSN
jgi:hypothetical protein